MQTKREVHGISCMACGAATSTAFAALCPKCHKAMLDAYPKDYFSCIIPFASLVDDPIPIKLSPLVDYEEAA